MVYFTTSSQCFLLFVVVLLTSTSQCVKIQNAKDFSGINNENQVIIDDDDDFVHDLAVKLKKAFADDLVSDLFATSYGLEKVARVH